MKLEGKKVLVVGAGKSGIAASELLLDKKIETVLYDGNKDLDVEKLYEKAPKLKGMPVLLGELTDEQLRAFDVAVLSPGVPTDLPVVERMRAQNVCIWGEIELAYSFAKGRLIAITGTNGKTTTTALTGEIMKNYFPSAGVGSAESGMLDAFLKDKYFNVSVDKALQALSGSDKVRKISVYPSDFDTKAKVISYLDAWNDSHDTAQKVTYTDTVGTMMSMVQTMLNAVTYVLVAFTGISLVVSSVMIGIITYVSVVERTKEIGVLRSLGARKKDIRHLFNAETFLIGLFAGTFGVAVTYLLSLPINRLLKRLTGVGSLAALPFGQGLLMIAVSVALTLISGLIPASSAAKKDPVVALRTE